MEFHVRVNARGTRAKRLWDDGETEFTGWREREVLLGDRTQPHR